jgi:ribosome maturation factor RimP
MKLEELAGKIRELIEPAIDSMGVELDDMELGRMKGKILLRVYIEKQGGVSIDDCEKVSREIATVLDVEDPVPGAYVLEVSSPGLDRPLRKPRDFIRFSGKKIRVVTNEPVDKQTFFVGKIENATDEDVMLVLQKDKKITISYNNISKARLEVEV